MSALEKLKTGISEGDWSIVVGGYAELTGETLPVPDVAEPVGSRVRQLIAALAEELQLGATTPNRESARDAHEHQQEEEEIHADPEADDEDGDEENRVETVSAAGESGRQTVYGNTQAFVTAEGDPPSQRIAKNRTRAGRTRKRHRSKPEVHRQACTQCGEQFDVPILSLIHI